MKSAVMLLAMLCGGCAAYTEAQMRLVEQAQRGLDLCAEAQRQRAALVDQYHQLQRDRLDQAFDADVQAQAQLSPQWVIEHRTWYAAALDALARQRLASAEAEAAARGNLDAARQALRRVLWLQSMQLRLVDWRDADQNQGPIGAKGEQ